MKIETVQYMRELAERLVFLRPTNVVEDSVPERKTTVVIGQQFEDFDEDNCD